MIDDGTTPGVWADAIDSPFWRQIAPNTFERVSGEQPYRQRFLPPFHSTDTSQERD